MAVSLSSSEGQHLWAGSSVHSKGSVGLMVSKAHLEGYKSPQDSTDSQEHVEEAVVCEAQGPGPIIQGIAVLQHHAWFW